MGNYKFRLSDMMPNAWFYKLKDMGRGRGHNSGHSIKKKQSTKTAAAQAGKPKQPHRDCPRKSYYFTRDPISSDGFFHSPTNPKSVWTKSDSTPDFWDSPLDSSPDGVSLLPELGSDRIQSAESFDGMLDGFETISELDLPPIITKPAKFNEMVNDIKKKEMTEPVKVRRMRLRNNSPRIASRKIQSHGRKSVSSTSSSSSRRSLSDSFAIVKSSFDPQRDFRDSMMEMIVENNIRASKDLEELLACYLSLNSDEYHDIIIKVFKQIWFDIPDVHNKHHNYKFGNAPVQRTYVLAQKYEGD
ncbi:unnamed protein product, partial [Vitis vinifera]|uniref:Transcription repressor n=1 Tax=Vitis vinifera TaxID=29760 RepID=A0A3S8YZ34_VITVI